MFPFVRVFEVLPPPPQLLHPASSDSFSSLRLFSSSSSLPPLAPAFLTSLLAYRPPISALVSIVSFCPPHVTQPLSSLVLLCFVPSCCFRILAAFVVVVRSLPRFPFCTGMPVSHKVLMTFSLLNIRRSVITTSTALHAFAPACALRRTPSFSLYPPLRTIPLLNTRICPPVVSWGVSSSPKSTMLKDRDYDVTAHIFLILSLTCTPKSTRGRRRFARWILSAKSTR